jgi:hypothetical protein
MDAAPRYELHGVRVEAAYGPTCAGAAPPITPPLQSVSLMLLRVVE